MSAQGPQRGFQSVSIFWLLPNVLTVAGLVSGLTALRFALDGRWSGVIGLIVLAAVFDALDGRTARRFKTASAFGAAGAAGAARGSVFFFTAVAVRLIETKQLASRLAGVAYGVFSSSAAAVVASGL